ncbi:transcriptional regulator, AsnC family [Quadrisphaera granulorum]|uniref:AsnC family transcriptional regulator n=1 Tax=Quadrisphaera granulorum TaxID=317664 RepID=A0A316B1F3_9ACTN|nr:AsnC family transcriptional regulator [Quadrisphaera granulorum]SZE95001.1 transcriptional regulator, AsnC family [Quadrisphaera granulorum]
MVEAYVLVQTDVGRADQVASALAELDGVLAADAVTGPYDVVVHIGARPVDDLGALCWARSPWCRGS